MESLGIGQRNRTPGGKGVAVAVNRVPVTSWVIPIRSHLLLSCVCMLATALSDTESCLTSVLAASSKTPADIIPSRLSPPSISSAAALSSHRVSSASSLIGLACQVGHHLWPFWNLSIELARPTPTSWAFLFFQLLGFHRCAPCPLASLYGIVKDLS